MVTQVYNEFYSRINYVMEQLIRKIPFQLILFLFFFGCLTLFINDKNTVAFGLQPLGIQSIVERGHVYLDTPLDRMEYYTSNYTWDVFPYNGHVYLAKQPGQFFIGSAVYFFLYKSGITYQKNSTLVSNLIALFTTVPMVSIIMCLIFNIAFNITRSIKSSFLIAIFSGLGTLLLPYSGLLHHDICATFFLFLGFYYLFKRYHISKSSSSYTILIAGFCIGLALFSSNNTPTTILVLLLYILCKRDLKDISLFTFSLVVGLSASLVFNFIVFGHPLNFPILLYTKFYNLTHEMTFFEYLNSCKERVNQYLFSLITAITFYSPIYLISYIGLFFLPQKYKVERLILLLPLLLSFLQPSLKANFPGYGWCQYGPRYLIESMPFTMIGLSSFFLKKQHSGVNHPLFKSIVVLIGIISVIICSVGTMGVVYCGYYENAFLNYSKKIIAGELPKFIFLPLGITCIIISRILYFIKYPKREILKFTSVKFTGFKI